jgi:hypothetical protein
MELEPIDPIYVEERLSQPPFTVIDGVYNVRDLSYSRSPSSLSSVKPRLFYRSAELSGISQKGAASQRTICTLEKRSCRGLGKEQLAHLGIRKIFDMRSDPEVT